MKEANSTQLSDPFSLLSRTLSHRSDSIATIRVKEFSDNFYKSEVSQVEIARSLEGYNGFTDEELIGYIKGQFNFADSIKEELPLIRSNHEWVAKKRVEEQIYPNLIEGGTVLFTLTGVPKLFKDGINFREIYKGKPRANLIVDVYYYRDKNDQPIILSYLKNAIIQQ